MRKPLGATLVWIGIAIAIFGIVLIIDYAIFRATLFGMYHPPPPIPSSSGNGPFEATRPIFLAFSDIIGIASVFGGAILFIYAKIMLPGSQIE